MGRLDQRFTNLPYPQSLVSSRRGYLRYLKQFNRNGARKSGRFRIDAFLKDLLDQLAGIKCVFGYPVAAHRAGYIKPWKLKCD